MLPTASYSNVVVGFWSAFVATHLYAVLLNWYSNSIGVVPSPKSYFCQYNGAAAGCTSLTIKIALPAGSIAVGGV